MSSLIAGMDYSLLLGGTRTGSSASILSALYNPTSTNGAPSTGNPILDLKLARSNETRDVARQAKDPQTARDISLFKAGLAKSATPEKALADPNVMKVLLTASNLSKYIQYPALATKALLSDPNQSDSLVNKLGDANLLSAAKTYNFAKNGLSTLKASRTVDALTNGYTEVLWRQSLDRSTPGLSNALAFLNQAKSISSVDGILGDPVNRSVVLTALGIPQQIAFQTLNAQEQAVGSRVKIADFQDPNYVNKLTDRYLMAMQQQSQSSGNGSLLLRQSTGLLA